MYLISGQPHLRLQPAVTLVAVHAELRLYTVQGVVGKDTFMPQVTVGKGAERLLRAAVCRDIGIAGGPAAADVQVMFQQKCRTDRESRLPGAAWQVTRSRDNGYEFAS